MCILHINIVHKPQIFVSHHGILGILIAIKTHARMIHIRQNSFLLN